ncbi:MAG: lipid II:glycine glycyltransferase FemX [Rubrobacter sp.]
MFSDDCGETKRRQLTEGLAARVHERGGILLEVEPRVQEGDAIGAGFEKSSSSVQPRCTFVLDVLDSDEEQISALPKDTRYGVRRARKQGVVAGPSDDPGTDLERFMDLLEETAERQSFALRPRDYYRRFMKVLPAHLIVARREGEEQLLAGAIILTFGPESVYLYGASTREGENLYASYLTQFEALSVVRSEGAKRYDMGGIPCAPVEGHPLFGVYRFKKKFGGREERYVGSHEVRLKPYRAGAVKAGIRGYYKLQKLRGRGPGPISD